MHSYQPAVVYDHVIVSSLAVPVLDHPVTDLPDQLLGYARTGMLNTVYVAAKPFPAHPALRHGTGICGFRFRKAAREAH